jgi:hypothetical protein
MCPKKRHIWRIAFVYRFLYYGLPYNLYSFRLFPFRHSAISCDICSIILCLLYMSLPFLPVNLPESITGTWIPFLSSYFIVVSSAYSSLLVRLPSVLETNTFDTVILLAIIRVGFISSIILRRFSIHKSLKSSHCVSFSFEFLGSSHFRVGSFI